MAQIKADEITKLIREQIENFDAKISVDEVGTVMSLGDGIARVYGLDKVMAGELIEFPHNVAGIAMNLEEDQVGAVLLGDYTEIKEGDEVERTGRIMSVPVGEAMIGRRDGLKAGFDRQRLGPFPGGEVRSMSWRPDVRPVSRPCFRSRRTESGTAEPSTAESPRPRTAWRSVRTPASVWQAL